MAGGVVAFVLFHFFQHGQKSFPKNLGNEKAAELLSDRPSSDSLKFAIIGDINNGTRTFEEVIFRLRQEKDVDFLVLLGDCAADPNPVLHDYFISEFSETGLDIPTFIVAGNHDIGIGEFEYEDFENLYGPMNFTFNYGGDLFIGLGGIYSEAKLKETLTFLEDTLREKRAGSNRVFVFLHYTISASPDIPDSEFGYGEKFQLLFEKYKVSYVFSGHYHRLSRTEVNGVVYFVTGGGGARFQNDQFDDIGRFHHLAVIDVEGESIAEKIIPIDSPMWIFRAVERTERWGLTVLVPFFKKNIISFFCVVVIVIVSLMGAIYYEYTRIHRFAGKRIEGSELLKP